MARTIIVVPCYNEARRLDLRAFADVVERDGSTNFLLVNDGSSDETLSLLEELHERFADRCGFLHLAANGGKAEAVRQGFLAALDRDPEHIGFWDADLATPLDEIPRFVAVLERNPGIDLVVGSRLPLLGRDIQRRRVRRLLGRIFATTASVALGLPIYDTQCGAKLFRVTPELREIFSERFAARWIFDVELMARMIRRRKLLDELPLGRSIFEQPLDSWHDVAGSKLRRSDFLKAFLEMSKIYWTYLRPGLGRPMVASPPPLPRPIAAGAPAIESLPKQAA